MQRLVSNSEGLPLFVIEVIPSATEEQETEYRPPIQGSRGISAAANALDEVATAISTACQQIVQKVRQELSTVSPDELELTFGIAVGAEGGLPVVSKVHGDANFQIRAVWRKDSH